MMTLSRREFLKSGVTFIGTAALMPAVFQRSLGFLGEQPVRGGPVEDNRVLVVVKMAGGNDGLNTVVPVSDGRYYDARTGISISQTQALPLDSRTGLHPSMTRMKELWDEGTLAIVEGVGYPNPNFSHFVSMDIWETADPALKQSNGWIGRYLERKLGNQEAPFLGLAVGGSLPISFRTTEVAVPSVAGLDSYQFQGDAQARFLTNSRQRYLMSLYEAGRESGSYGHLLDQTVQAARDSVDTLQKAHQDYKPAEPYPGGPLASALLLVAEVISANVGVKVCHVTIGGFDTHANQPVDHPRQLSALSNSLHAFYQDLKAHGQDSRVAIMAWSEFGRRVKANASSGTDHGTAGPVFFLGTPVKGGLYGQRPDLGGLVNGNMRYTVDFRSVYTTAIGGWLGAPATDILGGMYDPILLWKQ